MTDARSVIVLGFLAAILPLPARAQVQSIDPSLPFPPVLGSGRTFRGESCGGDDMQFGHRARAQATQCVTSRGIVHPATASRPANRASATLDRPRRSAAPNKVIALV